MALTTSNGGKRQERVKELLLKQVESEARVEFWSEVVRLKVGTRELENIGESLHEKFRSLSMKNGSVERVLVENGSVLKLRDEKRYRRELFMSTEGEKKLWRKELESGWKFKRKMNYIKDIARKHKRKEKIRLNKKIRHLIRLRVEERERKLEDCPTELKSYKNAIVYNKERFDKLCKENIDIKQIGDVDLSLEEKEILKLHQNRCKFSSAGDHSIFLLFGGQFSEFGASLLLGFLFITSFLFALVSF